MQIQIRDLHLEVALTVDLEEVAPTLEVHRRQCQVVDLADLVDLVGLQYLDLPGLDFLEPDHHVVRRKDG